MHVIYVMPNPERLFGPHSYSGEIKGSLIEQARADARRFLEERAEGVRAGGGAVAQTYLGTGRPDEEIVELAEEVDAAVVVTGSRGLGGIRRSLLGSVSDSVVRHAHCPVLIIRDKNQPQGADRTARTEAAAESTPESPRRRTAMGERRASMMERILGRIEDRVEEYRARKKQ